MNGKLFAVWVLWGDVYMLHDVNSFEVVSYQANVYRKCKPVVHAASVGEIAMLQAQVDKDLALFDSASLDAEIAHYDALIGDNESRLDGVLYPTVSVSQLVGA